MIMTFKVDRYGSCYQTGHLKNCPRMKIITSKRLFNQIINLPSNPSI